MKKYIIFLVLIIGLISPLFYINAATGFIPGQIWYSKDSLKEGDTVLIHTIVWNGGSNTLQSKVEFYDKNVILGSRDVSIPPEQSKDVSISWKVTSGDHIISAKIISSTITFDGKKEVIVVENSKTENSKIFVPVTITKSNGESVTSSDVIKNELDKASSKVVDVIPTSISVPVENTINSIDDFRYNTSIEIEIAKKETQERIKILDENINSNNEKEVVSATDKPIAYIKLFLLSVISLIFGYKVIFYGLLILIVFFILRLFYRKIKNR